MGSQVEQFFEKVATWKDHGKDYEHYHLKLDMAAVAYDRWRQSVKLTDDKIHDADLPVANATETATVQKLLGAIAAAFQDAEKRGGQLESKGAGASEVAEKASGSLAARYQAMIEKRQKGAGAWKKLRWVVHDKKVLTTLTERVSVTKTLGMLWPSLRYHPGRRIRRQPSPPLPWPRRRDSKDDGDSGSRRADPNRLCQRAGDSGPGCQRLC